MTPDARSRRRYVIGAMFLLAGVAALVAFASISFLQHAAMDEQRNRLVEQARGQARVLEAINRAEVAAGKSAEAAADAAVSVVAGALAQYVPSTPSGELQLARRAGDQVVFLVLQRRGEGALPRPLDFGGPLGIPMQRALSGLSGTMIGPDYRGVTVLAAYEPVAGLGLGIVAKVDLDEVRMPFRRAALLGLGPALGAILVGGLLLLRLNRPLLLRSREAERRYEELVETLGEGIIVQDEDARITYVNRRMCEMLGYTRDDLVGRSTADLFSADSRRAFSEQIERRRRGESGEYEATMVRRDGVLVSALIAARALKDRRGEFSGSFGVVTDISEVRRQGERLAHLNAVLRAIRNVNQLITRERDRDNLLRQGCRELVATEGIRLAWIVELDPSGRPVRAAEAGIGEPFEALRGPLLRGELPPCCREVMAAEAPVVFFHPSEECAGCPGGAWDPETAAVAVPLRHEARIHGVLVASVPRAVAADPEEVSLLVEVAGDLAFALHDLDESDARRAAEASLRQSEEKFELLFRNAPIGYQSLDENGNVLDVSDVWLETLGYRRDEVVGRWFGDFLTPEERDAFRQTFPVNVRSKGALRGIEFHLQRRDGSEVVAEFTARVGRDAEGRFVRTHCVFEDVTEQRGAERALRESEARYRSLFDNAVLGIYQTTPDGRILSANPALLRMLGFDSFEELAKRDLEGEGYEPGYLRAEFKERVERDGRLVGSESSWTRKDGSSVFVRENAAAVRDADGNVVWYEGTVEDITARREAEEARTHLEARLHQAQKLESIGTLASGIAHEINNPLTGIINYAQLIADRTDNDSLREFAHGIVEEGNRVAVIVRNLLSFSRQQKESHSPARVADIVTATLSLIGASLRKDGIDVQVEVPADLPSVKCRSQQIQQVVLNLLTNARDGLNARYPGYDENKLLRVTADRVEHGGRTWVRIAVEDHGVGISPALMGRVFDPFFTTKPRDQGTGLGLSISYGIARDHHGTLTAESEPNARTRFTVELPVDNGWDLGGPTPDGRGERGA